MNVELADHIVLIAAPIYAALLSRLIATYPASDVHIPAAILEAARREAIEQALALRLDVLNHR